MSAGVWRDALAKAQADVDEARDALQAARDTRDSIVAGAHAYGETIYGIAKALGVTQNAVRKMLGLTT